MCRCHDDKKASQAASDRAKFDVCQVAMSLEAASINFPKGYTSRVSSSVQPDTSKLLEVSKLLGDSGVITPILNSLFMKNTLLLFPTCLLFIGCSNASTQHDSDNVTAAHVVQDSPSPAAGQATLPDSATAFIQQHFAQETLRHVKEKRSPKPEGTFYEAELMNGTEIDFGKAGNWIEVNADKPNQLPTSFFPEAIRRYLERNFAGIGVESIDKDAAGYELELTNDIKLYFDTQGSFIRRKK